MIAGNDIANGCASSLTEMPSCLPSRASNARRVGSASAAKVRSRASANAVGKIAVSRLTFSDASLRTSADPTMPRCPAT